MEAMKKLNKLKNKDTQQDINYIMDEIKALIILRVHDQIFTNTNEMRKDFKLDDLTIDLQTQLDALLFPFSYCCSDSLNPLKGPMFIDRHSDRIIMHIGGEVYATKYR